MLVEPETKTIQVYRIFIKATAQQVWDAITKPEWTTQYGYAIPVKYDLRPGGQFRGFANEGMKAFRGIPHVVVDGEVVEADPPRKLVQAWRMLMTPELAAEGFSSLTYEIAEGRGGVTRLAVIHDVTGTPSIASVLAGEGEFQGSGGGWAEVLSGLKTLLETGSPLPFQSGR